MVRGPKPFTTVSDPAHHRPDDLVQRRFTAPAPNRLWVADLTPSLLEQKPRGCRNCKLFKNKLPKNFRRARAHQTKVSSPPSVSQRRLPVIRFEP
jgi:hypothetical protein